MFSSPQPLFHKRNSASLSLLYIYSHNKCSDYLQFFVQQIHMFTALNTTRLNHPHFSWVSRVRRKFHTRQIFPQELRLCRTDSGIFVPQILTLLISSTQEPIFVFPFPPHNLFSVIYITQVIHRCHFYFNSLTRVAPEICIR